MSFQKLGESYFDLGPAILEPLGPDRSLLAHCLTLVDPEDWAVEFGVGSGETTRMIAAMMPVIGFDSFRGLPEDWRPGYLAGTFDDHSMPSDIPGATIVAGWFSETLFDYEFPEQVGLVHFDADLYSSTRDALAAISPSIGAGTVLVFDEFHGYTDDFHGEVPSEQQAWAEYVDHTGIEFDVIGHGREQWAVKVR
jgi:hypothetical protein